MNAKRISKTANENRYEMFVVFETNDERDAYIAAFPKSVGKIYASTISGFGFDHSYPTATFAITLKANGVNGGTNETGRNRIAKFEQVFESLNLVV